GQIHFRAQEAVGPLGVHREGVSQEADLAFGIGATQKHKTTLGRCLEVERPVLRERAAAGSILDPDGRSAATGR
ncbi:unnamed protein product, partial [marine sediment metagenome]